MRKAKVHLELHLVRDVKGYKTGTYKYINSKRKSGENVGLLMKENGTLVKKRLGKGQGSQRFCISPYFSFRNPTLLQFAQSGTKNSAIWWRRIKLGNI